MSSIFGILGIGASGMKAHSRGVQVASDNIANANTPGYARRTLDLEPVPVPPRDAGGVRVRDSRRVSDPFLEARQITARSSEGQSDARVESLEVLDFAFSDEAGNIGEAINALESALGDLASNPGDEAARRVTLAKADEVARSFQRAADVVEGARADTNKRIEAEVVQVNQQIENIGVLTQEIEQAELTGNEASSLRDQRDELVRSVAKSVPVKVLEAPGGKFQMLLAGTTPLVNEDGSVQLLGTSLNTTTGDIEVFRTVAGQQERVDDLLAEGGGRIGGFIEAREGALTEARDGLDTLAVEVANGYNAVHSAGVGLDGVSGRNLFATPGAGPGNLGAARNLQLDAAMVDNPNGVAAALDAAALPSDNRNALALEAVAESALSAGGTQTFGEAFGALVADVGSALQKAQGQQEQAAANAEQINALRESVSGVSVDEETVSLIRYQRAFQASTQLVQVADEMLQDILNLKR